MHSEKIRTAQKHSSRACKETNVITAFLNAKIKVPSIDNLVFHKHINKKWIEIMNDCNWFEISHDRLANANCICKLLVINFWYMFDLWLLNIFNKDLKFLVTKITVVTLLKWFPDMLQIRNRYLLRTANNRLIWN